MANQADVVVGEPEFTRPQFIEAFRYWLKLGFINFGGPTGQIAIMHSDLVEQKRWISNDRFLHALNYCMLLPGPEAHQLAIYIGWLLHRTAGGIVAGVFFVLPSMVVLWGLSYAYVSYGSTRWLAGFFYGLKPAVVAIVACAVIRIGRRALLGPLGWVLALAAFIAIFLGAPFPLIILSAAIAGFIAARASPQSPFFLNNHAGDSLCAGNPAVSAGAETSPQRVIRVIAACLLLWFVPVALVGLWKGPASTLFRQGVFFSQAAMVTFGGAYAVLPYVAHRAVDGFHWLQPVQMLDGLGMAETTPGPLIMVLQFVGFMGGWNHPGDLPRLTAATLGALITTWVTFVPSFLWIFLGAPYVERLRGRSDLAGVLSAVTAAVVGVILNLALWFAIHVVFPEPGTVDWLSLLAAGAMFAGMLLRRWEALPVVASSAALGLLARVLSAK